MDKDLLKLLDDAVNHSAKEGKNMQKVVKMAFEANGKLHEGMWDFAQAAHQAAFPLATGNPFQPNFRALDPTSGVPSLEDQQKNNVIAAAVGAALVGITKIPGGWAALIAALSSAGSFITSLIPSAASAAASIGTAGIMAIVGGIVSVSSYLYPRISKLIKDVVRKGEIAKCEFEADGEKYIAIFSLSEKRWQLIHKGGRWLSKNVNVSPQDVSEFFASKFFNRFLLQCEKYINAVYDNNDRMKCLEILTKMSDKKSQKDMKFLLSAKVPIETYMFTGKYATA